MELPPITVIYPDPEAAKLETKVNEIGVDIEPMGLVAELLIVYWAIPPFVPEPGTYPVTVVPLGTPLFCKI
jgi:uncharacterized RDD family membrane protein YckC